MRLKLATFYLSLQLLTPSTVVTSNVITNLFSRPYSSTEQVDNVVIPSTIIDNTIKQEEQERRNLQTVAPTCDGVSGSFAITGVTGQCTYDSLLAEYTRQVFDETGNTCATGSSISAKDDLDSKLMAAMPQASSGEEAGQLVCQMMYDTNEVTPFTHAAHQDINDPTMNFEQQFYNGLTTWQDEVQTIYESDDGSPTSVLKTDAAKVREFYHGQGSYSQLEWPNSLTNFDDTTCTSNAAMCCWPKDRQANDGNGNCASPYDEDCVDKDVADNTNLCFADLEQGNASSDFDSQKGFGVYPENGEGAIHCHGFAWADDEYETTARYKANNLFFVSMYDHMYQRGYVKNIPGMPMCGCMDQMPVATRSDCTQVDLAEVWEMMYDGQSFTGKLTRIDINFNACRGRNGRNNDLWAYVAKMYDEGRMTADQFGMVGRKLTNDHDCYQSTEYHKQLKGYMTGYTHDPSMYTKVAGRDAMYDGIEPPGREAFNTMFFENSLTPDTPIIMRVCPSCVGTHRKIWYKRLTPIVNPEFDLLRSILYSRDNGGGDNVWNEDFTLHSSYDDAVNGTNAWKCPNNAFNYGAPFYGECSPNGNRVRDQYSIWNSFPGPKENVAYFVNTPQNTGVRDYTDVLAMGSTERASAGYLDTFEDGKDIGPVGITGNAWIAEDGSWHIQGSGNDIWDHDDQFHYMSKMSSGDIDVSVHVSAFSNNNQWAKAGIVLRSDESDDATSVKHILSGSNGILAALRRSKGGHYDRARGTNDFKTNPAQDSSWLRIVKKQEKIEFYHKANASDEWTFQGSDVIYFPDDIFRVGLGVTSHDNNFLAEATFENYSDEEFIFPTSAPSISGAPTTWDPNVDIDTQRAGEFKSNGVFDWVKGSGTGLWGKSDSFFFVNEQFPDTIDGLDMYIRKFANNKVYARGGVMIRNSNDADSAYAFVGAAGNNQGVVFQSRPTAGALTEHHKMIFVNNGENRMYVKLAKNGTEFTAYYKALEGDVWIELGSTTIEASSTDTVQVGRAVTAGHDYEWALEEMLTQNLTMPEGSIY